MLGLVRLDSNPNAIYVIDGIAARKVRSDEVDELTSNLQYDTGFQLLRPDRGRTAADTRRQQDPETHRRPVPAVGHRNVRVGGSAMSAFLADIASGESDWADVAFLVALIVAVVGAVVMWRPGPYADRHGGPLVAVADRRRRRSDYFCCNADVDWVAMASAFAGGFLVGVIVTVRLTKVLADERGRRHPPV